MSTDDPHPRDAVEPRNAVLVAMRRMWRLITILLVMMTVFRLVFVIQFAHPEVWSDFLGTLPIAFAFGALHDLRVLLIFALPPSLSLLWMRGRGRDRWLRWLRRTAIYWFVGITLVLIILGADQIYYGYFRSHFNILAFGAIDDDFGAILRGAWRNHPILLYLIVGLAGAGLVFKAIASAFHIDDFLHDEGAPSREAVDGALNRHIVAHVLLAVAFCSTPLSPVFERLQDQTQPTPFVRVVPDSPIEALASTVWERIREEPLSTARELGYLDDMQRAVVDLGHGPPAAEDGPLWERLPVVPVAPPVQVEQPPHVVLVLMESFSAYLLEYQAADFDLLGPSARRFKEGFHYPRFLPSDNISAGSLFSLVLSMPYRPGTRQLSQNDRPEQAYPGSLARAFADAGYETGFYYGGPLDWRELDRFLPAQGFERMVGQAELAARLDLDPKRDGGEWGLWDEHLLAAVEEDLRGATTPQFMVVFTTTNHPPHELPEGVDLPPLTPPEELLALTGPLDAAQWRQLRTYQYACAQLGSWLDRLEAEGLLERSIVGVTGDHTAGMRLPQSRRGLLLERAVPFLLLLPPAIRGQVEHHPELPGSHEDIGPTLLHAAGLAGGGLRSFGQSLLDPSQPHLAANAAGILLDREGAVVLSGPSLIAAGWEGAEGLFLGARAGPHDPADLVRRYAASLALVDGLVYAQEIDTEIRK